MHENPYWSYISPPQFHMKFGRSVGEGSPHRFHHCSLRPRLDSIPVQLLSSFASSFLLGTAVLQRRGWYFESYNFQGSYSVFLSKLSAFLLNVDGTNEICFREWRYILFRHVKERHTAFALLLYLSLSPEANHIFAYSFRFGAI